MLGDMSETTGSVLDRLLDPLADCWTPEVAQRIVEQRPDSATQQRIDELADKANEGVLTPDERVEYEEYVESIDFIGILKAKARLVLTKRAS